MPSMSGITTDSNTTEFQQIVDDIKLQRRACRITYDDMSSISTNTVAINN